MTPVGSTAQSTLCGPRVGTGESKATAARQQGQKPQGVLQHRAVPSVKLSSEMSFYPLRELPEFQMCRPQKLGNIQQLFV